jgi:hypothetical protein
MPAPPFGIAAEKWESLLRGIAREEYQLLLGAGSSIGGTDADGRPLPLGSALADELVNQFALPVAPGSLTLVRAYDAARRSRSVKAVDDYLVERFTGCSEPPWMRELPLRRWARIWTLNLDDCVDAAYANAKGAQQQPRYVSWTDGFRERDAKTLDVVHLHGRAQKLSAVGAGREFVFGIEQYLAAAEGGPNAWHRIFGDLFAAEPFLVIGASLSDEWDLTEILRRGNEALALTGRPSIIVLKQFDPILEAEVKEWGLIPVAASAESFFAAVAADIEPYEDEVVSPEDRLVALEAVAFLSQFRLLRSEDTQIADRKHDFYKGHDPRWGDIASGRDARLEVVDNVMSTVENASLQLVVCIHGPRFSGKSTALLRAGREFITAGRDPYLFVGDGALDWKAAEWWIRRHPTAVLLVDGLADQVPQLRQLLDSTSARNRTCLVVGTERAERIRRLSTGLRAEVLKMDDETRMGRLSDADVDRLVNRLDQAGRLGRITRFSRGERRYYFVNESDRDLFAAIARLSNAVGFRERLRRVYENVDDGPLRNVLAASAMSYALGYSLPVSVAAAVSGVSVRDILTATGPDGVLEEAVIVRAGKARPRQRAIAGLIVNDVLPLQVRYRLSAALARTIAPYVTRETIRQQSIHAKIVRELMDADLLRGWVGTDLVESWYAELLGPYGWNARYWEQRGLAASRRGEFDVAESYAQKAVDIHADPFTLNTLGVILLRRAVNDSKLGPDGSRRYYRRGVDALRESEQRAGGRFEHPFITFFRYTQRFAFSANGRSDMALRQELRVIWDEWYGRAQRTEAFAHAEGQQDLLEFHMDWVRSNVEVAAGSMSEPPDSAARP